MTKFPLWLIFILLQMGILIPLLTLSLRLFPGELVVSTGGVERTFENTNVSLSYFLGLGMTPEEKNQLVSVSLYGRGWILVFCYSILLPLFITYRIHLKRSPS
jgi:hypothetical protein